MTQPNELESLIRLSHRYGSDPAFVLAGGGNTSFKTKERLWVKASGHALAAIGAGGFVEMDRRQLSVMLEDQWPSEKQAREAEFLQRIMSGRLYPERGQRPSVEALLHHLLPDRFVVHTHPGVVNALTCCMRGQGIAEELFGNDVLWQPYVDPGVCLAQSLQKAVQKYSSTQGRHPQAIFLQNHGLIVSGETETIIERVSDRIISILARRLRDSTGKPTGEKPNGRLLQLHAWALKAIRPELRIASAECWLANDQRGLKIASDGPLTPDQIVYCRSVPLIIDSPVADAKEAQDQWRDLWNSYEAKFGFSPWVALVACAGMLAFRESTKMAELTHSIYLDSAEVYRYADALGGIRYLTEADVKFIEEWEVEAHRRAVMGDST